MAIPPEVERLIEQFDAGKSRYKGSNYREEDVRAEFLDPFFGALGWDMTNTQGLPEGQKDVLREAGLQIEATQRAPDYSFWVGGSRRFFVEAKKPAVNLQTNPAPAFQVRRYGWSAKLPVSIVTDFEEFVVYDCRVEPNQADPPSTARLLNLTYDRYADQWDAIADLFARPAVLDGALDQFIETHKAPRGTATVDAAFLKEISTWRDWLAEDLARRNPQLSQRELNYAVQMTIDRIIFLRICEDRGIEPYGRLQTLLGAPHVYDRLVGLFRQADERYNSGLFHFAEEKGRASDQDTFTLGLAVGDETLDGILTRLYYPTSPYAFRVIPVEILGQVYEQFLGKVIRLDAGHQAVVEEKPEVRKAGGVYYTPTYIVDYIVKHTVGPLLEGKTPAGVAALRILDPACGSGSFLIGAYQYLLDWHLRWYLDHGGARQHKKELLQVGTNTWRLTIAERKRILLNNIYGVDIDTQAVEVTKLSLLLKVLEGETAQGAAVQIGFAQERVLPDLGHNIKCGNSLIGSDFYAQQKQVSFLDEEERYRINTFDWVDEFPYIMQAGGFDAVIGNPPYIRIQTLKEWAPLEVEFYKEQYAAASKGNYDIYVVFVEQALHLLNECGRLGFILPHKFFNAQYGEALRSLLAKGRYLAEAVHFGDEQVFAGATTYTCLLFLDKAGKDNIEITKVTDLESWRKTQKASKSVLPSAYITASEWNFIIATYSQLFEKLRSTPVKLRDVATRMYQGPITSADTIYLFKNYRTDEQGKVTEVFSQELDKWLPIEMGILKWVIRSGSVSRYQAIPTALVLFPYQVKSGTALLLSPSEMEHEFPVAWEYLNLNKELLENRERGRFRDAQWYRFGRTQNLGMWERPKIMMPYMITELAAYLDTSENYYFINVTTGGYGIISDESRGTLTFLCGLLNSRLLDFYFKQVSSNFRSGYFAANKQYIEQLPIRTIDFSNLADKALHDQMVTLVEQMLHLRKQLSEAKTPFDRKAIERQIAATDRQIDQLVYDLYGLSAEERALVEGAVAPAE